MSIHTNSKLMETTKLSPVKRFWLLLKPDKLEIRNIYIYAIIIGMLNLVLPIGIQAIINLIQGGAVSTSWVVLIILVAAAIAMSGILQINQLRITENLQQKIFTRAAFEFTYRIPKIRLEQLFKQYAPELMNRFFDVVSIQKGITKLLIDFSSASIQVLFGLILLSLYHPFFIVFSLLLVLIIVIIFWMTIRKGLKTSLEESKHKYLLAHWLEELARSNTTFKLAGKTNLPMNRTNEEAGQYNNARENHFRVLRWQYSLMVVFKVLVAVGLLLIGGLLVIDQQMNIGQFVAAEIVILLIVNSVEKVILSFETIYDVLTSLEKLGQVTDLELENNNGIIMADTDQGIELELNNISYHYPQEERLVINDLSLAIKSKERVLITGKNDSGKSTLLYLVSGLLSPSKGSISIDGIPSRNYEYDHLMSQIGGYLRDETLFEGTLLENITLGRENASFENVKWAIKNLNLSKTIKQLGDGYHSRIYPQGKQFSKSTVAKILLARAIADKPRLLLLENSFSVFSTEDKQDILTFLLNREHNWTVLLSSSQELELPHLIDHEIILESGKIINEKY
ncbi:MAG: ABC-type bacteriocin/lantibiotic exporter with double-glycine peptidase domain [Crocinitomicaceae bacterium]|jgi:ABC-type bacteriocin/lantibiotic exporter with double-glycine peptidase domain